MNNTANLEVTCVQRHKKREVIRACTYVTSESDKSAIIYFYYKVKTFYTLESQHLHITASQQGL